MHGHQSQLGKEPTVCHLNQPPGPSPPHTTAPGGPSQPQHGHHWPRDSLAIGLQLTDLEVDQQVILAVAGPRRGTRQCAELGGGH